jgi:hypothetical protein
MPNCAIFYAFLCSRRKKRGCGVWKSPVADLEKSAENKVFSRFCADSYTREKAKPLCKKV